MEGAALHLEKTAAALPRVTLAALNADLLLVDVGGMEGRESVRVHLCILDWV